MVRRKGPSSTPLFVPLCVLVAMSLAALWGGHTLAIEDTKPTAEQHKADWRVPCEGSEGRTVGAGVTIRPGWPWVQHYGDPILVEARACDAHSKQPLGGLCVAMTEIAEFENLEPERLREGDYTTLSVGEACTSEDGSFIVPLEGKRSMLFHVDEWPEGVEVLRFEFYKP